jgi:ankyrin repeat protein
VFVCVTAYIYIQNKATPLFVAAQFNQVDCMKLLVAAGADIHLKDSIGSDALYIAAEKGQLKALEYLLSVGANVDASDDQGCTPLYLAAQLNHVHILEALVKHGAVVDAASDGGTTPLYVHILLRERERESGRSSLLKHNAFFFSLKNKLKNHHFFCF